MISIKRKIYLSGFDVFKQNAILIGKNYKKLCEKYNFEGLFPLDNELSNNINKETMAKNIFEGNIKLMDKCDIIVANLNNFRGYDIDSGTAFELGYCYARNKTLIGYMENIKPLINKIPNKQKDLLYIDKNNYIIENFNFPVNLMISIPCKIIQGTFEDCLIKILSKND